MLTSKPYQNKLCQPDGGARRGDTSAERRALRSPLYFFSFSAGAREAHPASAQTRTHFCSSQRRKLRAGWGRPRSRRSQRSTSAVLESVPVVDARLTPSRDHIQKLIGSLDFDKPIKKPETCLKLLNSSKHFSVLRKSHSALEHYNLYYEHDKKQTTENALSEAWGEAGRGMQRIPDLTGSYLAKTKNLDGN